MHYYGDKYDTASKIRWQKKYTHYDERRSTYDGWFDDFIDYIKLGNDPIIDLGCGSGNNAYKLNSLGKKVIACDYVEEALTLIKEHVPNIVTKCFDMRDGLPFNDNFTDIIIADLSLHYFSEIATKKIVDEIDRVLKPNGLLLLRINSTNDVDNGSEDGIEIEKHYRRSDTGGYKRFFDRKDIDCFFGRFEFLYINEEPMSERYEKNKILWKIICKSREI